MQSQAQLWSRRTALRDTWPALRGVPGASWVMTRCRPPETQPPRERMCPARDALPLQNHPCSSEIHTYLGFPYFICHIWSPSPKSCARQGPIPQTPVAPVEDHPQALRSGFAVPDRPLTLPPLSAGCSPTRCGRGITDTVITRDEARRIRRYNTVPGFCPERAGPWGWRREAESYH